jgi:hypothetical protein
MSCTIASNNISCPELRKSVSEAVRDGIGERSGEWNVVIYQAPDYLGFAVRIEGPKGLRWSWTFGEQEQAPEFIQQKVAQAMQAKLLSHEESSSTESGQGTNVANFWNGRVYR